MKTNLEKTDNRKISYISQQELSDKLRKRTPVELDEQAIDAFAELVQQTAEIAPIFDYEVVLVDKKQQGRLQTQQG